MAPKAAQQAAQKKAAKQKKLLIGLGVLLVLALVYAISTLSSLGSKPAVSAVPAASTTPASSTTTTPSATAAPATPAPTAGISPAPVGSLRAFGALGRKDPFNDNGPEFTSAPATPKQTSGQPKRAVISINGKKFSVALGAEFGRTTTGVGPALFKLVKVSDQTAVISVVSTKQNFTLHLRQPVTLTQKGAWKETLILEPAGTSATVTVKRTSKG